MNLIKKLYQIRFFRFLYLKFINPIRNQRDINIYFLRTLKFGLSIDVGANKGLYSLELERISNQVIIFEPLEIMFEDLKLLLKKETLKFSYGLGDTNQIKKIKIPIIKNSLSFGRASITNKFQNYINQWIKIKRLDDVLKRKKIYNKFKKVDFIKIDVEGYEKLVLNGALNTIKKDRPIILIELELRNLKSSNIKKIFHYFYKLDYEAYFTNDGKKLRKTKFENIKNHQKKKFFIKDIERRSRYKLGEKKNYICNYWFMPKNKND